jgi:hypothetical protein
VDSSTARRQRSLPQAIPQQAYLTAEAISIAVALRCAQPRRICAAPRSTLHNRTHDRSKAEYCLCISICAHSSAQFSLGHGELRPAASLGLCRLRIFQFGAPRQPLVGISFHGLVRARFAVESGEGAAVEGHRLVKQVPCLGTLRPHHPLTCSASGSRVSPRKAIRRYHLAAGSANKMIVFCIDAARTLRKKARSLRRMAGPA